jgi:UDP-glucuronate decarboxylase
LQALPADDPLQRRPDIALVKEKLNWETNVDLEDRLIQPIEFFGKLLKSGKNDI